MRTSPNSTIVRSGSNERGWLSCSGQITNMALCAAVSSASVAISRLSRLVPCSSASAAQVRSPSAVPTASPTTSAGAVAQPWSSRSV